MPKFSDEYYMNVALKIARRGLGRTAPNPSVGCVIVKDGHIIAAERTSDGGRPHAEVNALNKVGTLARGCTAYVSLEPCSHTGKTGPCSEALIKAGVKRVVIACTDPDPRVSGRGINMLKEAGIDVTTGICEKVALDLNAGFFLTVTDKRPWVTLKIATSADYMISHKRGEQTFISGELSKRQTHLQRSLHDAILVGSETFLIDKPKLTTRIEGYDHDIRRFILDGRGRLKHTDGFEIITHEAVDNRNIKKLLEYIAAQGVTRLFVEGGAKVHKAFLKAGYCDEFIHNLSTNTLGDDGVKADYINDLQNYGLRLKSSRNLLKDRLDIYTGTN